MRKFALFASLLLASAAAAQNVRSAVSRNGLDSNPCTVASPCRSFAAAISVTNDGGDIVALDTAGYGPFSFDRSLTVSGAPGVEASITATIGTAVVVNTQAVVAAIRNLTVIGAGADSGIAVNQAKDVFILNCLVRGFRNYGIVALSAFGANVNIERTRVLDTNGGIVSRGVFIGAGNNSIHGVMHDCLVSGTGNTNVEIGQYAYVTITNSTISNSGGAGVFVDSFQGVGAPSQLVMESCNITNNLTGLQVGTNSTGSNPATAMFSKNVFVSNTYGVYRTPSGTATSFGNNRFVDNAADSYPSPFPTTSLR